MVAATPAPQTFKVSKTKGQGTVITQISGSGNNPEITKFRVVDDASAEASYVEVYIDPSNVDLTTPISVSLRTDDLFDSNWQLITQQTSGDADVPTGGRTELRYDLTKDYDSKTGVAKLFGITSVDPTDVATQEAFNVFENGDCYVYGELYINGTKVVPGGGSSNFTSQVTIAADIDTADTAHLSMQDTGEAGDSAKVYIDFRDSANTLLGEIGYLSTADSGALTIESKVAGKNVEVVTNGGSFLVDGSTVGGSAFETDVSITNSYPQLIIQDDTSFGTPGSYAESLGRGLIDFETSLDGTTYHRMGRIGYPSNTDTILVIDNDSPSGEIALKPSGDVTIDYGNPTLKIRDITGEGGLGTTTTDLTGIIDFDATLDGTTYTTQGTIGYQSSSNTDFDITSNIGLIQYNVPTGEMHQFRVNSSEEFRIENTGVGVGNPTTINKAGWSTAITAEGSTHAALELVSNRADANAAQIGGVAFYKDNQTSGHKNLAMIDVVTNGATANERGGELRFRVKDDAVAATPSTRMKVTYDGVEVNNADFTIAAGGNYPTPLNIENTQTNNCNLKFQHSSSTTYFGIDNGGNLSVGSTADLNGSGNDIYHTGNLSTVSQVEAETGLATTARAWTAERVKQAITALAPGGGGGSVNVSGTPVDNQLAVWTSADTIEGVSGLTFDGTTFSLGNNLDLNANNIIMDNGDINGANMISADSSSTQLYLRNLESGSGSEVNMQSTPTLGVANTTPYTTVQSYGGANAYAKLFFEDGTANSGERLRTTAYGLDIRGYGQRDTAQNDASRCYVRFEDENANPLMVIGKETSGLNNDCTLYSNDGNLTISARRTTAADAFVYIRTDESGSEALQATFGNNLTDINGALNTSGEISAAFNATNAHLTLQDTSEAGTSAKCYMDFKDSGATVLGEIGFDTSADGNLNILNNISGANIELTTNGGSILLDGSAPLTSGANTFTATQKIEADFSSTGGVDGADEPALVLKDTGTNRGRTFIQFIDDLTGSAGSANTIRGNLGFKESNDDIFLIENTITNADINLKTTGTGQVLLNGSAPLTSGANTFTAAQTIEDDFATAAIIINDTGTGGTRNYIEMQDGGTAEGYIGFTSTNDDHMEITNLVTDVNLELNTTGTGQVLINGSAPLTSGANIFTGDQEIKSTSPRLTFTDDSSSWNMATHIEQEAVSATESWLNIRNENSGGGGASINGIRLKAGNSSTYTFEVSDDLYWRTSPVHSNHNFPTNNIIDNTSITNGYVLKWNSASAYWEPAVDSTSALKTKDIHKTLTSTAEDVYKIGDLGCVVFTYKDSPEDQVKRTGFVADYIRDSGALPEVVTYDEDGEVKGLIYEDMIAPLYVAYKEEVDKRKELEERVAKLEELVNKLTS